MLAGAETPQLRALLYLAGRAGLRASELRAVRWSHLDLGDKPTVTISERADRWNQIGSPKSEAAHRIIPLGNGTVKALKELRLAHGRPSDGLLFGTGKGAVEGWATSGAASSHRSRSGSESSTRRARRRWHGTGCTRCGTCASRTGSRDRCGT